MTYADSREGKPVILTAALTGGTHGKEANPQLPETPATIDEAAAAAEAAGASIVLLHARRENGELPVNSYNNPYQAERASSRTLPASSVS